MTLRELQHSLLEFQAKHKLTGNEQIMMPLIPGITLPESGDQLAPVSSMMLFSYGSDTLGGLSITAVMLLDVHRALELQESADIRAKLAGDK